MSGRGVGRVLDLIEWLATRHEPVALADVVAALDYPKSSTLLMLRTLVARGYVQREPNGSYRLVRLPGDVAGQADAWGTLVRLLQPLVEEAVAQVQESGFIAVLGADRQLHYLNKVLPEREIRYDRDITRDRPPHRTASGIVLLGGLPDDALQDYLDTVTSEPAGRDGDADVRAEIARARADGYHVNTKGLHEGAAGVSAPVFSPGGDVIAAINLSGPRLRLTASVDQVIATVVSTAQRASELLARRAGVIQRPTRRKHP